MVLLVAFLRYERHHRSNPLIEPTLLTNRTYLGGIAVVLALFGAFGGLLLCVSLYGQLGEGWSPIHAGLTLTPMVVGMILGMVGSFAVVNRLGRHLLHIGVLLIAAGAVVLALILTGARTASSWDLVPGLFLIGAGAGASIGQLFQIHPHQRQHGRSRVRLRCLGSRATTLDRLGVAVLGTIFFSTFGHHLPTYALRDHSLGLPGTARSRLPPRLPTAHARARRTDALELRQIGDAGGEVLPQRLPTSSSLPQGYSLERGPMLRLQVSGRRVGWGHR